MKRLVILVSIFLVFSCSKKTELISNGINSLNRESGLTSFNIPENYLESPNYEGVIYDTVFIKTIQTDSNQSEQVTIEVEWSENDLLLFIGASEDWVDDIGLEVNIFEDELYSEFCQKMDESGAPDTSGFWDWLLEKIIGKTVCGPCVQEGNEWIMNCCWIHWLFADNCWDHPC